MGEMKKHNMRHSLEEYYHSLWAKMAGNGLSEIELGILRVKVCGRRSSFCGKNSSIHRLDIDESYIIQRKCQKFGSNFYLGKKQEEKFSTVYIVRVSVTFCGYRTSTGISKKL